MLRAVIFDLDGTLVDVFEKHLKAFQEVIESRWGLEFTKEDLEKGYGMSAADIVKPFFEKHRVRDVDYDWFVEERRRVVLKLLNEGDDVKVLPGVKRFLRSLKGQGIKVGLATSALKDVTDTVLEASGLEGCFDAMTTGEEITKGKPNPGIFLKTSDKLGVKPDECVVVEDSLYGVEAGKEAGMFVAAVATGHESEERLKSKNPNIVIKNLKEINVEDLKRFKC